MKKTNDNAPPDARDSLASKLPGLASGAAVLLMGLAVGLTPPPVKTVAEWAAEKRMVSAESGSPYPGKWSNERVPYMVEPMECMSLSDPCRSVTLAKSAQVAGTECGVNLFGYVVDENPAPMMIVLPTLDELRKYNRVKLQPTIDETPALKKKIEAQKSRDESGSTTLFKKFRGGFCQLTGANSSAGLQMLSVRVLILEEVTEFPPDVDGRGDPAELAEKRTTAWSDTKKVVAISTPGIAGACRVSERYEASDQRRYYVPCPHCGDYQVLKHEQLKHRQDVPPYGAYFECLSNQCTIEHFEKVAMVTAGVWVKTYDDADGASPPEVIRPKDLEAWRSRASAGREPGFHIWQAYSPLVSWDDTVDEWKKADGDPLKEKIYVQQVKGEAYEEEGDAPDYEELHKRRETYVKGKIPPGGLMLTGAADVQGNRLEWAVYAWGIGMTAWIVDHGIIEGDPAEDPAVWRKLDEITKRTYEDWQGNRWPIEAFGVDSGYLSSHVYQFCRRKERLFATDGRAGALQPILGAPTVQDIDWEGKKIKGGVKLWPVGTHPIKSDIYARLRKTIEGPDPDGNWKPGAVHFYEGCDLEFFKQITAEYLDEVIKRDGRIVREWVRARDRRNEQLDLIVICRALAWHFGLDQYDDKDWLALAKLRGAPPEDVQRDLAELWSTLPETAPAAAEAPSSPAPEPSATPSSGDVQPKKPTRSRARGSRPRGGGVSRARS